MAEIENGYEILFSLFDLVMFMYFTCFYFFGRYPRYNLWGPKIYLFYLRSINMPRDRRQKYWYKKLFFESQNIVIVKYKIFW